MCRLEAGVVKVGIGGAQSRRPAAAGRARAGTASMRPSALKAAVETASRRTGAAWTAARWTAAAWTVAARTSRGSRRPSPTPTPPARCDSWAADALTGRRDVPPGARQTTVADLVAWTDSRWEQAPSGYAEAIGQLTRQQRLSLGLVLFGRVTYQAAAAGTGLTPAQVSAHCCLALRHLSATTSAGD